MTTVNHNMTSQRSRSQLVVLLHFGDGGTREPRPATNSGRRTCPPPEGGRAAMGRFPRSLPPGRRGRCPAIPRQPRQGYAAALLPGLLTGHYLPAPESLAATATGVHCTPAHIRQVGAGTSLTERQRWFLAYTFSSCL